jgi:hypothetical protein
VVMLSKMEVLQHQMAMLFVIWPVMGILQRLVEVLTG